MIATWHKPPPPGFWCDPGCLGLARRTFLLPRRARGCRMHSFGHPPPLSFPSFFLPPLSAPFSILTPSQSLCRIARFVTSLCCPASVVSLLFLLCRLFCFALLLFCAPGLGYVEFLCASPPFPFSSLVLPAYCVLPLPVVCFVVFLSFSSCLLWLAALPPLATVRVCETPQALWSILCWNGGGMDRCLMDLCHWTQQQLVWSSWSDIIDETFQTGQCLSRRRLTQRHFYLSVYSWGSDTNDEFLCSRSPCIKRHVCVCDAR